MSADLVVAVLGAGGLGGIVMAIITGIFSKRKLGAEAADIITKAAAGVVTNMQAEIDRQINRNNQLVTEHRLAIDALITSHDEEMDEVRRVLQLHVAWDAFAIARLADVGIELPPAPPLLPARRFDHPSESGTLES